MDSYITRVHNEHENRDCIPRIALRDECFASSTYFEEARRFHHFYAQRIVNNIDFSSSLILMHELLFHNFIRLTQSNLLLLPNEFHFVIELPTIASAGINLCRTNMSKINYDEYSLDFIIRFE